MRKTGFKIVAKGVFPLALLALSACGGDSAADLNAAIAAGQAMNDATQACVTHAKAYGGHMRIAECSSADPRQAYLRAKGKLHATTPALDEIDATNMRLGMEVVQMPQPVLSAPAAATKPKKK